MEIGGKICERIVLTGAFVLLSRNPLQAYIAGLAFGESLGSLKFTKLEPMPGFHIENFGCRAARADGEAIAGRLRAFAERQPFASDVVVVLYSVTAGAIRLVRSSAGARIAEIPLPKFFVTGCYAQRAPQELASMAGVAAVVGLAVTRPRA